MISTVSVDVDVKNSIKDVQNIIKNETNINLDLKDILYLIFKSPEKAVELVNENLRLELNKKI